jgi:S-formylglutathione hydrolase FrmB
VRRVLLVAVVALAASAAWIGLRDWRRGYERTRGATIVRFTLRSALAHRDLHEILVLPAGGGRGRELLVFLHGRSSPPGSNLRQPLFDALHDLGRRAPAVLLADGGDHSYWHDRRDGSWGESMLRETIPAGLARSHADRRRVAIGGISMGGFGALDLARLAPAARTRRPCGSRAATRPPAPSTTRRTSRGTTWFAWRGHERSIAYRSGSTWAAPTRS